MFPPELTITIRDQSSCEPVARIALILTLFASRKNDYHIPLVTNQDGSVKLTIDYVRWSIQRDRKLFIMDYVSSLEDCSPEIEIEVCSTEQVERTIGAMDMYKEVAEIDQNLANAFRQSLNHKYRPTARRFTINEDIRDIAIIVQPTN